MKLTAQLIEDYENSGFLFLPAQFSVAEVELLKAQLTVEFANESERRVHEKDGRVVRSVYGSHLYNETFRALTRHPGIALPAMQLLGGDVYVYQFKINAKLAFAGDQWEWHQDYIFWLEEDGLPQPNLTNVVIYLDEVNEFNGPMLLIPGSHKEGVLGPRRAAGKPDGYGDSPDWISNLTADLKYSIDRETLTRLVQANGIVAPKGPAGSVLFFHPNTVHGSAQNMSPRDRALSIVTYSHAANLPLRPTRPDFLVSRDFTPIQPSTEDAFLEAEYQQAL